MEEESLRMKLKSFKNAMIQLFRTWITAIGHIIYRSSFSLLFDPKGAQKFLHCVLNTRDTEEDDPVLKTIDVSELLNNQDLDISILDSSYKSYSSETRLLKEISSLAYMVKVLKPNIVFETGTFIGRTTRLFANNSPELCEIFTLDLPQHKVPHQIGKEFMNTPQAKKITQLYGDSRKFDFSKWYGKCDFVWIDGCHDYDFVLRDTENALKLCSPNGWITWHDYRHTAWWSGVTRCVRELYKSHPNIVHLKSTTIAVLPGRNNKEIS